MVISRASRQLTQAVIFSVVTYVAVQLAIYWGVDEKSWWQMSWEFVTGGSLGAIAGLAFFVIVGAVGWVSGPIFGSIGLLGLMAGGALGGMGLGALVSIARNPSDFNFSMPTVVATMLVGIVVALALSSLIGRKLKPFEALNP